MKNKEPVNLIIVGLSVTPVGAFSGAISALHGNEYRSLKSNQSTDRVFRIAVLLGTLSRKHQFHETL